MKTMTAIEASRNFRDVLDLVERGETVRITRYGEPVADVRPSHFDRDIEDALALVADAP